MATVTGGLVRDGDGRPFLPGTATLPPMTEPPATTAGPATTGQRRTGQRRAGQSGKRSLTTNRFAVLNAFVDCSLVGLSRAALATWLVLYRDTRNGTATTSQADIARRAGLSVRSVRKAVCRLTRRGLLVVVVRGGLNRGPSRYRVESLGNQGSACRGNQGSG